MNTAAQSPQMQQLLEQMHDIQAPPPVAWWPPAPGWWILAALGILAVAALVIWARRRRAFSAYRRQALRELAQLQDCAPPLLLAQLNSLLKRTALQAYAPLRRQISGAFGPAWVEWLNARCKQPVFTGAAAEQLAAGGYAPGEPQDTQALLGAAQRWIAQHQTGRHRHQPGERHV